MVTLVYVDYCILISKDDLAIQNFIDSLKTGTKNFVFTEEETMNQYLGIDISPLKDKKGFTLLQPLLIERIIQYFNFDPKRTKVSQSNTPSGYPLLNKDENGPSRKATQKYCGIISMLGYLQGTT